MNVALVDKADGEAVERKESDVSKEVADPAGNVLPKEAGT